jgi:glutamate-1-semialdehyde aminotransferase
MRLSISTALKTMHSVTLLKNVISDIKTIYLYKFHKLRGIYFSPAQQEACFISSAHSEESLRKTKEVLVEFCEKFLQ